MNKKDFLLDVKVWFSLLVYVIAIYFVISPDSYTHNLTDHVDSAWFFMDGKAWMNGFVPYVDIADSKGPLLFLLTGIGYLISNYDYVGVFWVACLWYSITLFFCYKLGTLLTQSRRKGYLVALFMAFPYFCYMFHFETRAEDWCQPFLAASLYCLMKEILRPTKKSKYMVGLTFGIAFIGTLLIKWSIAVMMLSFIVSVLLILKHRKQPVAGYLLYFLIGAVVSFLPYGIYTLVTDSFGAFIHIYFTGTAQTVSGGGLFDFFKMYYFDVENLFVKEGKYLYVIYIIAIYYFYRKKPSFTIYPFLCGLFFLAISIKHDDYNYYLNAVSVFAIFLVVIVVEYITRKVKLSSKNIAIIYVVTMILSFGNVIRAYRRDGLFFQDKGRKEFYDFAYVMSQIDNPKIVNGLLEYGLGMPVHTLPATLHYSHQNGATEEMEQNLLDAIKRNEPDFVLTVQPYQGWKYVERLRETTIAAGYQYYLSFPSLTSLFGYELYGRKGLKLPPKDFQVSDIDILLKRKIRFD